MKRIVMFGAGNRLNEVIKDMKDIQVVALVDNSSLLQGKFADEIGACNMHVLIQQPNVISSLSYDYVVITPYSMRMRCEIVRQLINCCGVNKERIMIFEDEMLKEFNYKITDDGNVLVQAGTIKLLWKYDIEKIITKEVFYKERYNWGGRNDRYVVFDIGMNVGIASLFFAQRNDVECVYGFEPFPVTYQRALENISLNVKLMKKIVPYNFGLSDEDETIDVVFMEDNMGGNRTMHVEGREGDKVQVCVKKAGHVLEEIIDKNAGVRFVLKIDCEGAEYRILKSLDEFGLIEKIDIVLMETHDNRQEEAQEIFTKHRFTYFWNRETVRLGSLWAVRNI